MDINKIYVINKRYSINNCLSYTLRNNDVQSAEYLAIRLKFIKLIQKDNPKFTITINSAGLPLLSSLDGVLSCTIYRAPSVYNDTYFIRLVCNSQVDANFVHVPIKSYQRHTYNKHVYIYNNSTVDLLRRYYSIDDFIEVFNFNIPTDVLKIVYSYLIF
jgi:hypothetical protein